MSILWTGFIGWVNTFLIAFVRKEFFLLLEKMYFSLFVESSATSSQLLGFRSNNLYL